MRYSVGDIERLLFKAFPAYDAEPWDRCGIQVGDRNAEVRGIVCALNASPAVLKNAHGLGANLLLTHHPVCIEMPFPLGPMDAGCTSPSSVFYEAARLGIAIISMHTNLDRSLVGSFALARALNFEPSEQYEKRYLPGKENWGRLGSVVELDEPLALETLFERCKEKIGGAPRCFGEPSKQVQKIVFLGGSLGSTVKDARSRGFDLVISGECSYHTALDYSQEGLAVILLGHDYSELMLVDLLKTALIEKHVPRELFIEYRENPSWWS